MTRKRAVIGALALSAVVVTVAGATAVANSGAMLSPMFALASGDPDERLDDHVDEDVHAGIDSLRAATMLNALRNGDPLICELLVENIGNHWSSHDGSGQFQDARVTLESAKDSVHGRIGGEGTIKLLLATLETDDPCVRRVAAEWLGRSRVDDARLLQQLDVRSTRTRSAAAYAIGVGHKTHGAAGRRALEKLLRDGGSEDGAMAAWALGEIEDSASAPALMQALRSPHAPVRLASVDALGSLEEVRALKELERLLHEDASAPVRAHAAEALGDIGSSASVNALADAIRDAAAPVRYAAVAAIGELHDLEVAPQALVAATQSADAKIQTRAVMVLAEIHDPKTVDALLAFTSHPNREVRLKVAEAFGEIKSAKASSGLMQLLKDSDPEVRRAAAEALGEIRP